MIGVTSLFHFYREEKHFPVAHLCNGLNVSHASDGQLARVTYELTRTYLCNRLSDVGRLVWLGRGSRPKSLDHSIDF